MKTTKLELVNKAEWILEKVKGSRVLHVGCTDWPLTETRLKAGELLHAQLCEVCEECVGVDMDREGIQELKKLMPEQEFHEMNAEKLLEGEAVSDRTWDYIVAGDVVEHMDNPGMFFQCARKLIKPGGSILVTVPSTYSAKRFFWILFTKQEQVHPDHTGYFSESTLFRIGERNGLKIAEIAGFQWINPTLKNRIAYLLAKPILWLSGGRCADELAVEYQLK
jgi:2-polyprenyl-3-methyl-5-hydroxy-6-metoxy-1,4-benzoquinol methylase